MWTKEFPVEEGWYWFYGWDFGLRMKDEPRLHTVSVFKAKDHFVHICDGHFIYKSEAVGVWCPLKLIPELPDETDILP